VLKKIVDSVFVLSFSASFLLYANGYEIFVFVLAVGWFVRLAWWVSSNNNDIFDRHVVGVYKKLNNIYFSIFYFTFYDIFRSIKNREEVDVKVVMSKKNGEAFYAYFRPSYVFLMLIAIVVVTQSVENYKMPKEVLFFYLFIWNYIAFQLMAIFLNSFIFHFVQDKNG